jgi:imidazolonepropionase-like amidohydrolase
VKRQSSVVARQSLGSSVARCSWFARKGPLAAIALTVLAMTLCAGAPGQTKPVVLKGGKLLTVSHGTIDNGILVMENSNIAALGAAGTVKIPAGAQVIDVTGMTVFPGMIDSETNLGLTEISAEQSTNDLVEISAEIMPHMHVYDAFHAESELIPVTRLNGITNAIVAPEGKDTLPGQDSFIQLAGASADEMLMVRDVAMPLNFTGKERRNQPGEKRAFPETRMGMAAQLRQIFLDAQDYEQKWSEYERKKSEPGKDDKPSEPNVPKHDLKLEALLPYLHGKRAVVLAAEEASDLETAVHLANEFHLKFVLNHIIYSKPILDFIASLKVPGIVGPIYEPPKPEERYDSVYRLPAELAKRGVKIAFASYDSHNSRNLPYQAGFASAFGLPYDEAMKAVTLNAAEIWGVADRLGSLDPGKTANVVVATGDPLDVKTDIKQVYMRGQPIPMTSRQTRLRDEYWKK